ncbi:hypothetical protein [[Flexibacter] sp. ATCC 35208]|nr:hypothetical protein [[Flexibacter] sp. ATCC 35208]
MMQSCNDNHNQYMDKWNECMDNPARPEALDAEKEQAFSTNI